MQSLLFLNKMKSSLSCQVSLSQIFLSFLSLSSSESLLLPLMEEPKLKDQNGALSEKTETMKMKNDPIGIHEIHDDDDDNNISGCSSWTTQVRLAALAISSNVRLRSSDMPVHMQEHALRYTRSLTADHQPDPSSKSRHNPTQLARALKKEFDSVYGPAWHCVIGKSFGSFVTHTPGGFVYFSIDSLYVLLFKTEVQLVTQKSPLSS